ncbi:RusA family crossover junction endodeoxyribonuclease [Spiractinospora alimapuensis]|uniref:RusA family crossover junction endodeoxyribonuclease n=1 Tax=Spiractinospora alimapuensis TaxID=2820884 RepID=UPI001F178C5A|nr:RusA family crossover junction endodeoxyribonuclease [Spiractinospora alimapuensis]QVQ51321.1 RusA family crossover junction endodeoxyribonuclease [Spiractinospora alimapuensis]
MTTTHATAAPTGGGPIPALAVTAYGAPAPQGSLRHIGGGRLVADSPKLRTWRHLVAAEVRRVIQERRHLGEPAGVWPHDGPVAVRLVVTVARPRTVTRAWPLRRSAGDLDKHCRAILDALAEGGALVDDSRVVALSAAKTYPDVGDGTALSGALARPGARIDVTALAPTAN